MSVPLKSQLTMCDMIPDNPTERTTDQGIRRSCVTYDLCQRPAKEADNLYSFVQWQKHNEDLLSRSAQGHHQSSV